MLENEIFGPFTSLLIIHHFAVNKISITASFYTGLASFALNSLNCDEKTPIFQADQRTGIHVLVERYIYTHMCILLFFQILRLGLLSGKWWHLAEYQRHLHPDGLVITLNALIRGADQA